MAAARLKPKGSIAATVKPPACVGLGHAKSLSGSALRSRVHVTPPMPCVAFDRDRVKQQFDITFTTIAAYGAWFALGVHLFAWSLSQESVAKRSMSL